MRGISGVLAPGRDPIAPALEKRKTFAIVTTWNLPEAYVLARYLCRRDQRVAILNLRRRPLTDRMRVVRRLWKNRGSLYVLDQFLARLFGSHYVPNEIVPFPDLDTRTISEIRKACTCFDCDDLHSAEALQFLGRRDVRN